MSNEFEAIVIERHGETQVVSRKRFAEDELMDGDVTVRVLYSSLNYKDGLALTSKAPVVRRFPMVPGIDFAGVVEQSSHPDYRPGDEVILNGWGTGETHLGAYAQKTRVKGDWLIPLPAGLTAAQAMALGTSGYTAMLSVMALEKHGCMPKDGPAIVTGAAGGVGSLAVTLLAKAGWHVVASTGRLSETAYLNELGAAEVIERGTLDTPARPLGREGWAAGVDVVGSLTLANVLSRTKYGGAIAACGLAGGMDLPTTVAPFILRGVALLGVDSVMAPKAHRIEAWRRLARDIDPGLLEKVTNTVSLDEVIGYGEKIIGGQVRGRVVVTIP